MRVLFAAGGTAGHINPALAIADKIKSTYPNSEILFIGTPNGMEARLVVNAGYAFTPIKMAGIQRKLSIKNISRNAKAMYYYVTAQSQARKIIKDFKPDLAIGTGGYVTAPVLTAAAKMGIKTATHESNSFPGVTTKMLSKRVDKVFVVSGDTIAHLPHKENAVVTGNPLRNNIPIEERSAARERLGLPDGITILSFGGSLGANRITEAVVELLSWESKKGGINHIHSYGGNGKESFQKLLDEAEITPDPKRVILKEYIDNMYTCMCAADLIIARAGAMTLTELMVIGRASILVPFPQAAENHQYYNALTLKNANAAILVLDKDLTKMKLIDLVSKLYNDKEHLELMGDNARRMAITNAADIIISEITDLVGAEKALGD